MVKILLVEDNEMNLDMLSRRLIRQGFHLSTATDGRQALEKARSERPDVILMDMSLPLLDGWEGTLELRADPNTAGLRIIALTSHAMSGDREKAISAGCDDYDTKPVVFTRLLEKIHAQVARGRTDAKESESGLADGDTLEQPRVAASSDAFIMLSSHCSQGAVEIWLSRDVIENVLQVARLPDADRRRIVEENRDAIWRIAADRYVSKIYTNVQRPNGTKVISILLEARDLAASFQPRGRE